MRVNLSALLAVIILSGIGTAQAKDRSPPPAPQAWQEVVKCKALTDSAARLACYDAQIGKLEQAAASGEVVMADKAQVRDAKKGLFGFRLPGLGIFGGGDDDKDEVKSIEGSIAAAKAFGYGSWRITLADGSVWEQTDDQRLVFDPAKGNKVKIYRGALGTFKMNIDGQRAIKVRRVE
jgi:hypothetical protein